MRARRLLAQVRGHQLAETRKQLGLGQKQIATVMGVSVARVSQIEHGEVTSFEVIAATSRPSADGWTSWPISATGPSGCPSATPRPPHDGNRVTISLARDN
jgi:DNA-binding XRE family transcriptional regulator